MQRSRMPRELWRALRRQIWARDRGRCQGPHCAAQPAWSLALRRAHIDHICPVSKGGTNAAANLRTLCRRCHVLRAGHEHQGMVAAALRAGLIPPDWRALVWDG